MPRRQFLALPALIAAVAFAGRAAYILAVTRREQGPVFASGHLSRFHDPVFLSYGFGDVLQGANCADTYSGPRLGYWNGTCNPLRHPSGDASVIAGDKRRVALDYMSNHLEDLPLVVSVRVGRLWSVFRPMQTVDDNRFEGRPKWASEAGMLLLFPLVAPAVIATRTAAATYGLVRFRAPAEVSVVALAAVALDAWIARRHNP